MDSDLSTDSDWVDVAGDMAQMKDEDKASRKSDILVVFQNQRWYVGVGWDAPLVTDRCEWSNGTGALGSATRPPWMDDKWTVDLGGVPQISDADGWTYGSNMNVFQGFNALGSKDPSNKFVRRRRWVCPRAHWPTETPLPRMVSVVRPMIDSGEAEAAAATQNLDDVPLTHHSVDEFAMDAIPGKDSSTTPARTVAPGDTNAGDEAALPVEDGDSYPDSAATGAAIEARSEAIGAEPVGAASESAPNKRPPLFVRNIDVYEHRNMISAQISDINGDGYIGEADNIKGAVLAVARYAQRLPEAPERLYFTWHHGELHEVAIFGIQLSTSSYAYRIYCWTEEEARAKGRINPNQWPAQNFHTSGVVHFGSTPGQ